MHLAKNRRYEAKCGEAKSWSEELVFEKFLSVESILIQIFTHVEFSCVFFTDQIFMSSLFHLASTKPELHPVENLSLSFPP